MRLARSSASFIVGPPTKCAPPAWETRWFFNAHRSSSATEKAVGDFPEIAQTRLPTADSAQEMNSWALCCQAAIFGFGGELVAALGGGNGGNAPQHWRKH